MERVLMLPQKAVVRSNNKSSELVIQQQTHHNTQQIAPKTMDKTIKLTKEKVLVQDIFAQVDEALRKRQAENIQLLYEVAEYENQLTYLQQQTKEQSMSNAAISVSLSITENNLNKVDNELFHFQSDTVECTNENYRRYKTNCLETGSVVESLVDDMQTLSLFQSTSDAHVKVLREEMEIQGQLAREKKDRLAAAKGKLVDDEMVAKKILDKNCNISEEIKKSLATDEDITSDHIEQSCELDSLAANVGACELRRVQLGETQAGLQGDLTEVDSALFDVSEERASSEAQCTAALADLQCKEIAAVAKMEQKTAEMRRMLALKDDIGKAAAEAILLVAALDSDICDAAKQTVAAKDEVVRTEAELLSAGAELAAARQRIVDAAHSNELYYDMTCERMKELRDLHQLQPGVEHDLLMMQRQILCETEKVAATVATSSEELAEKRRLVEEEQDQVATLEQQSEELQVETTGLAELCDKVQCVLVDSEALLSAAVDQEILLEEGRATVRLEIAEMDKAREMLELARELQLQQTQESDELLGEQQRLELQLTELSDQLSTPQEAVQLHDEMAQQLEIELGSAERELASHMGLLFAAEESEALACLEKIATSDARDYLSDKAAALETMTLQLKGCATDEAALEEEQRILAESLRMLIGAAQEAQTSLITAERGLSCELAAIEAVSVQPQVPMQTMAEGFEAPSNVKAPSECENDVAEQGKESAKRKVVSARSEVVSPHLKTARTAELSGAVKSGIASSNAKQVLKATDVTSGTNKGARNAVHGAPAGSVDMPPQQRNHLGSKSHRIETSFDAALEAVERGQNKAISDSAASRQLKKTMQQEGIKRRSLQPIEGRTIAKTAVKSTSAPAAGPSRGDWFLDDDNVFG